MFVDQAAGSTSPPHSTRAIASPISKSYGEMKPPSRMLSSSISSVAMPVLPPTGIVARRQRRPVAAFRQRPHLRLRDPQQLVRIEDDAVGSAQITHVAARRARCLRHRRHRDLLEVRAHEGKLIDLAAIGAARDFLRRAHASSLLPPPAGSSPTPASTRPMYDSSAATARSQCMMNSQPPPSAMPRTAATVGTRLYFSRCDGLLELGDDRLRSASHCRALHRGHRPTRDWRRAKTARRVCQITRPRQLLLGLVDRREHAVEHVLADGVRLALEGDDGDVVARVPHAHARRFRRSSSPSVALLAEHRIGEVLPP